MNYGSRSENEPRGNVLRSSSGSLFPIASAEMFAQLNAEDVISACSDLHTSRKETLRISANKDQFTAAFLNSFCPWQSHNLHVEVIDSSEEPLFLTNTSFAFLIPNPDFQKLVRFLICVHPNTSGWTWIKPERDPHRSNATSRDSKYSASDSPSSDQWTLLIRPSSGLSHAGIFEERSFAFASGDLESNSLRM